MNRETAKEKAKGSLKDYVNTRHRRNTSKLFRCLNRDHEDKKPSMSYDERRNKIRCFSGSCNVDWDIFDLVGNDYGLTDDKAKFDKTYEVLGINIDNLILEKHNNQGYEFENVEDLDSNQQPLNHNNPPDQQNPEIETTKEDLTNFFLQAQSNISDPACLAYLSKRGISDQTARDYGLGYISDWKSPTALSKGKNPLPAPRIIIPTSQYSYTARDARDKEVIPEYQKAYTKMKVGGIGIFNIDALISEDPCFVVEGEFDALSLIEIGYNAVALGSTSNTSSFLDKVKEQPGCCPLILALDADTSGQDATKKLDKGLEKLGMKYIVCDLYNGTDYNDPNDFLIADKVNFKKKVREFVINFNDKLSDDAQSEADKFDVNKQEYFKDYRVFDHIAAFRDIIKSSKDKPFISTGFTKLDEVFGGGLYDALYVIGAISSLGKTTFVIQIADHLAYQGHDVLYFSLEMSRYEIMAKSISRHTYLHCTDNGIPANLAKDTRQIITGRNYEGYTSQECDIIYSAGESYKKYANKLFIHEGTGELGVKQIESAIEKHQKYTGNTPIVIVDYLQILAPYNNKSTDKQNTDKAVLELKRISRDHKTPVIAISSLNRQSYKDAIGMEAFKESGAIEYSSDVLIGLQLKGVSDTNFNVDIAKSKSPREVELKVLKNRNGKTGDSIDFSYYSRINLFKEVQS